MISDPSKARMDRIHETLHAQEDPKMTLKDRFAVLLVLLVLGLMTGCVVAVLGEGARNKPAIPDSDQVCLKDPRIGDMLLWDPDRKCFTNVEWKKEK